MKFKIMTLFIIGASMQAAAQLKMDQSPDIVSQRGSFHIMPLYQRWSFPNAAFSEVSSVLSVYHPISRSASLSLRGAYGSVSGDIPSLSSIADVELSGNYYFESADVIASISVGIPSGKKKLTRNEFITSLLISNNVFRLQVPQFGEGLRLSPGLVWAMPVVDGFVLGLGVSFQYRGAFNPLENFGSYDPGDEISGTLGFDVRVGEMSSLAGDVVYTKYGKDKVDGLDVFAPGDKLMAVLQYAANFSPDELTLVATYKTRAKADVAIGNLLTPLQERIEPNQGDVTVGYAARFSDNFLAQFFVEGRFFEQTPAPFSGMTLLGLGVMPEFSPGGNITIPLKLRYVHGSGNGTMSGVEAGIGIAVSY